MLGDQLFGRVEPDGEDDHVARSDRVLNGGCACARTQFVRERLRVRFVLRGEDDRLVAVHEVARDCTSDIP